MIDRQQWAQRLRANVLSSGDDPMVFGYSVEEDLITCPPAVLQYICLTGLPPDPVQLSAFSVALALATAISIGEAPVHAAVLARLCAADTSSIQTTAAAGLAEQSRFEVATASDLLSWLRANDDRDFPLSIRSDRDEDKRTRDRVIAALIESARALRCLRPTMTRRHLVISLLFQSGLVDETQLQRALVFGRLLPSVAEALTAEPGAFKQYPTDIPRIEYVEER